MINILLILLEWSIKNKEYFMSYILYTEFKVGIPIFLLYTIEEKMLYNSISEFLNTSSYKHTKDFYSSKIFTTLKRSKYIRLVEWNDKFGYRFIK